MTRAKSPAFALPAETRREIILGFLTIVAAGLLLGAVVVGWTESWLVDVAQAEPVEAVVATTGLSPARGRAVCDLWQPIAVYIAYEPDSLDRRRARADSIRKARERLLEM
jgi:hypothetical protein